jgi:drug/metabolite transporter (DMT)-like permease
MNRPAFPPKLGIAIAVMAMCVPAIFIRLAQADSLAIAFLRLGMAALILWPITGRGVRPAMAALTASERWRVVAAGAFLGMHMFLWVTAVNKTTVASASFLIITQPILVAVLAHFFLQEKLNRWVVAALFLTLAGSALINLGDLDLGSQYLWGDFLALLGAVMAAFYLLAGRSVRTRISLLPYITVVYSVSALVLLPACLLLGTPLFSLTGAAYFWIFMLALIPTLIGHSLFNYALGYLKAFTVNASIVIEPIGATLLAWFIFREQPSFWLYPGAALLVISLIMAFRGEDSA